jgi:HAD superfamily hydrolase (TIGR01509 family)
MVNKIAFLFDLDGVIIDSEPQYDIFWRKTAKDYQLGIENFENVIKGTTMPHIVSHYLSHLPETDQQKIVAANQAYELEMDIIPIPGALDFLESVKNAGIIMGLVTSSDDPKIAYVFSRLPLRNYFETIVSADRITQGKPHPMCYLLAAQDLGISPADCYVFEDSFHGIQAGNNAGMKVIGLSTSNPAESIRPQVWKVIPDFCGFSIESIVSEK